MWTEYTSFEEHCIESRDLAEKQAMVNKQRSVVEDKHKLAQDV